MKWHHLILIIHLMAVLPLHASDWKLVSESDGIKVWLHPTDPDITGSMTIKKTSKRTNWANLKGADFFKKFETRKKKFLGFMGISEWRIDNHAWTSRSNHYQLRINGKYRDSSQQDINFNEVHYYFPEKTIQLFHTCPSSSKSHESHAQHILDLMEKEAGLK